MSVFFKGKNLENINRDTLEALRYVMEQDGKREKIRALFEEARVTRKDIRDMVETGELTEEQAQQEELELIREVNKEKHRIETEPFAERNSQQACF